MARIERDAAYAFARIVCQPAAGVERGRYVLVIENEPRQAQPPDEAGAPADKRPQDRRSRRTRTRRKDGDAT